MNLVVVFWVAFLLNNASSFPKYDSPLFLTPYIEAGKIKEAQLLSFVSNLSPHVPSYSGFLTVDEECNSNLWFWFFPSQNNPKEDPVSIWLNGGPGSSSMNGLFTEIGPYELSLKGQINLRKYSWTRNSSIIFVDNPVGTGFSFADNPDKCYSKNQTHIGQNFLIFLKQFFQLFPEYKQNPFFLCGQSYAGKYIPAIAYTMLKNKTTLRLSGIAIGNGLIDPKTQFSAFSEHYYQLGIMDKNTMMEMKKAEAEFVDLIDQNKFLEASKFRWDILDGKFGENAGYTYFYNYLENNENNIITPDYDTFLDKPQVRKALHVGNVKRSNGKLVNQLLEEDKMKSIKPWFEYILEKVKTMLYFGQMDLRVPYSGGLKFIESLNWSHAEEYKRAKRKVWKVNSQLAGYIKTSNLFTEVMVRNSGHMVPSNQPEWAFDLYNRFIFSKPFNTE